MLTARTRQAFRAPTGGETFNRNVETLRRALSDPALDPRPASQSLYKTVFCDGQLEAALKGAKTQVVLWFLDGTLRYVPIGALHDGKTYLAERARTNVVLTPESTAREWTPQAGGAVLGLGTSEAHQVEVGGESGAPGEKLSFGALSAVPGEVRGIVRDGAHGGSGPLPGAILLDADFTGAALKRALRRGFTTVHVASHFSLRPGDDTRSFLLLGDGSPLRLSQWDTDFNLQNVDLLTLSACETGVSSAASGTASGSNGAEVDGLGQLAQKRGANSVLATLWPVADSSTSALMLDFYRRRAADPKLSKIEALREAQLALLHGETHIAASTSERSVARVPIAGEVTLPPFTRDPKAPFAHPYYWAPFILIGNWR